MSGIPSQQQKDIGVIPQGNQSQNYAPAENSVNQSGQYMSHLQSPAPPAINQEVNSNGPQSPFKPQVPTNLSPSHKFITNNSNNAYSRNSSPSLNAAVPNSIGQFSPQQNSYQQPLAPNSSAMPYPQTSVPSSSPINRPLLQQQSLHPSAMRPPTSAPLNYPSLSGQNSYSSHLSTSQPLLSAPPLSNQPHTINQPPTSSAYGHYAPPISGTQQSLPNSSQHQIQHLPARQINSNMPPLMSTSQPPQSLQYPINGSASSIGPLPPPAFNPTSQPNNKSNPPMSLNRYPQPASQTGVPSPHPGQPPMPNRYPPNPGPAQSYPTQTYQQPGLQSQPPYTNQPQFQGSQPQFQTYQTNGPQQLTQQMGQLNVSQAGFSQMWGHQMVDLLQTRNVLPEHKVEPPPIRLTHQFAESVNCSPECTVNRIPETNALLQKCRLPLGILIHPFKDLDHLPVIQCSAIVRCRACRTYINPFVFFVDSKRWKCNLCFRVNDLPDEFQYDPVSKSYGDPTRRPEIKSATIEFIAPAEYMLRPPQPAVYLFLLDVSQIARESGYIKEFCETLSKTIDRLPGDARTQVGFICYDAAVHFYCLGEGLTRPREMTVIDVEDVFLPSPSSLLVNVGERKEMIMDLLESLPTRHSGPGVPNSALGAALQAAYKLMSATGGRISVFQTSLPNAGPGGLTSREDPNARSSKDVNHLNPATDFYKRLALDCSGMQVAVDLFLLNSQYADLATLSGISKFSGGSIYHIPLYKSARNWQSSQFVRMLTRYLSRKIGFEAVMRVRCTRGVTIHTFHGNFFVRSTDLLSLPNVSPDAGYGMQLTIEESLSDLQNVCFQAALLYTSSKGERRIRVHTMCLPIANNLTDVLHSADQQCIIGMLTKMAVDRSLSSSLSDAREALTNVALDALGAFRMSLNLPAGSAPGGLAAPVSLRLLPLYLLASLKHPAFRVGTSTRLDDRVAAMCAMKSMPLPSLLRALYPDLYPLHDLSSYLPHPPPPPTHNGETGAEEEEIAPDPPRLHLSAEKINSNGAYLLDDGDTFIMYVGHAVDRTWLQETFGVTEPRALPERELPCLDTEQNILLHAFVEKLNDDRPYAANIIILSDSSPNRLLFTERLVDDRVESSFSYYEFLQHIKAQIK